MSPYTNDNRHINNVCVFCGSRSGNDPVFAQEAEILGRFLAQNQYTLVYGSGTSGIMGVVSKAAQDAGGDVFGVNVHFFQASQGEVPLGVIEHCVEDMFQRKAKMLEESQAYIVLPGGMGTLDELGEVLVENDIKEHHTPEAPTKPVVIINTVIDGEGYYDDQLRQLQKNLRYGFTNAHIGRYYIDVPNVEVAVNLLNALNAQGPVPISHKQASILKDKALLEAIMISDAPHAAPCYLAE